jgi:CTP:molybdopterin cytidylyltransferase MocA
LLDEGHGAVWRLMRELGAMEVEVPASWSDQVVNINTPQDLKTWRHG